MRTRLCDVLGIDVPILLAPFGPWEQVYAALALPTAEIIRRVLAEVRTAADRIQTALADAR